MTDENIENREDSLRVYEVGYLLLPSIPEEKLAEHVATLKKFVADGSGKLISEENPQSRPLAYEMVKSIGTRNEKFNSAYFGWMKFELPAESIAPLQEQLTAHEAVLRFLLIKTTREATYVPRRIEQEVSSEESETPEVLDKKIDELVQE
jgi:ribosomal protein S6